MRRFLVIWFGQVVSMLGTGLTGFALGLWVYQTTGSVTRLALIGFFTSLPGIVILPWAGALVDRSDRRRAMIASNLGAGLSCLGIALLLWAGRLAVWHIYVLMAAASIFTAFQLPAFNASITLLVPPKQVGRASGLLQLVMTAQIAAPLLAAVMLHWLKIWGILLVDVATFLFAILTLLAVDIPNPEPARPEEARSLWGDTIYGWRYLHARPGLLALLAVFAGTNFTIAMVQALLTPLVLSFASPTALGTVMTVGGVGMLLGTVAMSIWGGPQRRIRGIFGGLLMQGLALLLAGLRPNVALVTAAALGFSLMTPVIMSCSQALWQTKVEPAMQGRVFAVRRMVALSSLPLAFAIAGPLADRIFEPLLAPGGVLAGSVGRVIGTGAGRGIGLLVMVLGLLSLLGLVAASGYPPLRRVEDELPDALAGAAAAPAARGGSGRGRRATG
jgi:MFS family permease